MLRSWRLSHLWSRPSAASCEVEGAEPALSPGMALFGFGVDRTTLYETFDSKSRVMPSALSARAVASSALPAQAGIAECGQVVEQGDGLAEVLGRAGVVLVIPFRSSRSPTSSCVVGLDPVEQRGQRASKRVLEEPVAPLAVRRAAGALGPRARQAWP